MPVQIIDNEGTKLCGAIYLNEEIKTGTVPTFIKKIIKKAWQRVRIYAIIVKDIFFVKAKNM